MSDSWGGINDVDYVSRAKNLIREATNNSSFELSTYFRCSVIYTLIQEVLDGSILHWRIGYKRIFGDEESSDIKGDVIQGLNCKRYTYNKRNIALEYPETQLTDKLGFEEFHAVERGFSVLTYNENYNTWNVLANQIVRCELKVTYSDDEPIAGDEKPKRYLANLDFGYRRSRRNNKNRRKYRNRY